MTFRGADLEYHSGPDGRRTVVDGSIDVSPEVEERLRLDREDGDYRRNYFLFLVGLPMKLTDPSARLDPGVRPTTFEGREVEAVSVVYPGDSSYPHWEFFFDPDDARLLGARFYREGPEVDGETIVMEGLAEAGSLRLPRERRWYMNADGEHLGTDVIAVLEVGGEGG